MHQPVFNLLINKNDLRIMGVDLISFNKKDTEQEALALIKIQVPLGALCCIVSL